jgi:uncharacterized membrane protein YraQ (UPF0718 family)
LLIVTCSFFFVIFSFEIAFFPKSLKQHARLCLKRRYEADILSTARKYSDYNLPFFLKRIYYMKGRKKQIAFKEDIGKLFVDLGKLVFGGVFLGGILRGEVPQTVLVIGGFVVATVCFILGLLFIKERSK